MEEAEFDRHALAYEEQHRRNIALSGEDPSYFAEYKIRLFSEWAASSLGQALQGKVLDFGAGIGNSIPYFRKYFGESELTCSDISQKSLDFASKRFPGPEHMLKINQDGIPAPDASFDAVFSACVLHHIPHSEHEFWLKELRRVVRPGGAIAIFEHNPFNPLTRRAVSTCPFDENARLLRAGQLAASYRAAGWQVLRTRYHIFFPRFAAGLRNLESLMHWMPVGAQYSVSGRRPDR
ncbi:MAG TPA: class I SAM-dependent methyltransferase [Roseiarcus sp.]|jgi:ubiquinone/menaquinone biosynthesis C-methylase UbiE|nr:class I SAM-dependent methyltransferase [Roseiarcus sp.]